MASPTPHAARWEAEGRRIAAALDGFSALVVAARDGGEAAHVAIGIAQIQAANRRVAIADLVGDAPPLVELISGDDPHGIADSFLYGVSLNRVARQLDEEGNLFLMPSGSEPVAVEEIIASDRWQRLAAGFREVGALLLLVATTSSPGIAQLVESVDGVIAVGDAASDLPRNTRIIAGAHPNGVERSAFADDNRMIASEADEGPEPEPSFFRRHPLLVTFGVMGLALATGLAIWIFLMGRSLNAGGGVSEHAKARADSVRRAAVADSAKRRALAARADSLSRDSLALVVDTTPAPVPVNLADSVRTAAWAVNVLNANTPEGATLDTRARAEQLPARTLTPVLLGDARARWWRVTIGAFANRAQADSMLTSLRSLGLFGGTPGTIIRVPYAFLLDSGLTRAQIAPRIATLTQRGVHAYPLVQADGRASLYTGAFETPEQSLLLADVLRRAGLAPVLAYRTGRAP
jgi:hypothetical protein